MALRGRTSRAEAGGGTRRSPAATSAVRRASTGEIRTRGGSGSWRSVGARLDGRRLTQVFWSQIAHPGPFSREVNGGSSASLAMRGVGMQHPIHAGAMQRAYAEALGAGWCSTNVSDDGMNTLS